MNIKSDRKKKLSIVGAGKIGGNLCGRWKTTAMTILKVVKGSFTRFPFLL